MILTLFCSFSFAPKNTIKSCETESLSTLDRLVIALSLLVCMVLCMCGSLCVHACDCEHAIHPPPHNNDKQFLLLTFILSFSVVWQFRIAPQQHCNGLRFASFSVWLIEGQSCSSSSVDLFFLNFRLVVSSLEALESCFAVGSSNEKVKTWKLYSLLLLKIKIHLNKTSFVKLVCL